MPRIPEVPTTHLPTLATYLSYLMLNITTARNFSCVHRPATILNGSWHAPDGHISHLALPRAIECLDYSVQP